MNEQQSEKLTKKSAYEAIDNNWNNENFKKNFEEIRKNPDSNYFDKVGLFKDLPDLELKKEEAISSLEEINSKIEFFKKENANLESENLVLKTSIENLEKEAKNLSETNKTSDKTLELKNSKEEELNQAIKNLENKKTKLEKQINGGEFEGEVFEGLDVKFTNLEKEISGLSKEKTDLETDVESLIYEKYELESEINGGELLDGSLHEGLIKQKKHLQKNIEELKNDQSVAQNLAEIKKENKKQAGYLVLFIAGCLYILCFPVKFGINSATDVIDKYTTFAGLGLNPFGLFLLKIPSSLLIFGLISGVIILLSKLIDMIKKIFDQQRDISQILAIAETIDKKNHPIFC
jgi:chromosome segregation ATPase